MPKLQPRVAKLDPGFQDAVDQFKGTAARNVTAMTNKQLRDQGRERIKLDVPVEVKVALEILAARYQTSQSRLGAWLLAYGMTLLAQDDETILAALEEALGPVRAINIQQGVDIDPTWLEILSGIS